MSAPAPHPRTRPLLSFARRNLLALTAVAFVVAPSSFALAATTSSSAEKTTRICIVNKTSMLRYVKSPGTCRRGERSFFVSRRGVQGLRGVPGKIGAPGQTGAAGVTGTTGATGPKGNPGLPGAAGADGSNGTPGANGTAGATGGLGIQGPPGPAGADGSNGTPGTNGTAGATGGQGLQGPPGPAGSSQYAEFFALMPADNAATVASGSDLLFPQDGPGQGSIIRLTSSSFTLTTIGTYRVAFGASITEAGQLQLTLDNVGVPHAVFGRATGTGLINGEAFITTTTASSTVTVRNVSAGAVTLTPLAGGSAPVTAYLTIQQLN